MNLREELDILLITYNRKFELSKMIECIFADNSPIKDCSITFLDNCSTDGTSEMLAQYAKDCPNVTHIRHKYNIGGDANVVKAMELASKTYFWILCDDDIIDWSHWGPVQKALDSEKYDLLAVGRWDHLPEAADKNSKEELANRLIGLTWIPGCIFKTSNISSEVMANAYFSVCSLFPIMALTISIINKNGKLFFLDLDTKILYQPNYGNDVSYFRGTAAGHKVLDKRSETLWQTGWAIAVGMIKDPELRSYCMRAAGHHIGHTFEGTLKWYLPYCLERNWFNSILDFYTPCDDAQKDKFYKMLWELKKDYDGNHPSFHSFGIKHSLKMCLRWHRNLVRAVLRRLRNVGLGK